MSEKKVAVIMGSQSDWSTMKEATKVLESLEIPFHAEVVSAHRTPEKMYEFAKSARSKGFEVIIAGAGGAAHLPGMVAALTSLPVLGVPIKSKALKGMDSLLSIVQMPKGIPVACLAIGESGAVNSALLAASILSINDTGVCERLTSYRNDQSQKVLNNPNPGSHD